MRSSEPYEDRDARAAHLAGERPHAAEILELYRRLLALQRPFYQRAASSTWLGRGWPKASADAAGGADLGLETLPFTRLVRPLRRFVEEATADAPPTLAAAGTLLAGAPAEALQALLERTVALAELEELADELGSEVLPLVFFSRAFLQPVAEGLVARADRAARAAGDGASEAGAGEDAVRIPATCPRCGWPPQVAMLRDEPEAKGRRLLICGLCAAAWPFPRVRCPSCGESDPDKLVFHESEESPYLRIEECGACRAYVKAIDLRQDGAAVPLVDDLASPELDVWADERGLWKIARNLMGM